MRMRRRLRGWVAVVVTALPLATASAGWWDDLDKGEPVRLSDVTSQPERWKGKVVTFACIYHGFDSVYQPYFTSFNAEKWLNATAWYDGAPIWEMEAFRDQDFPFLYLERTHPQRDEMLRLEAFTRIEVTGRVKDVYRNRPFIEILGFRVTPATFGKNVADWMKRADAFAAVGDYANAEANYRLVLAQVTLDETTRLRAQQRLDAALRVAGRGDAAAKANPVLGGSPMPQPDARAGAAPAAGDDPAGFARGAGGDPFATGGATPVRGGTAGTAPAGSGPSALTTDDLPGTPVDEHPGSAAPGLGVPGLGVPALPPLDPRTAPPTSRAPRGTPPAPACPAAPSPDATAPSCAPADAVPPPTAPGQPPPRSPRLSGVR